MRRLFTTEEALDRGLIMSALRWGQRTGAWRRVERGVYAEGPDEPTAFDHARAALVRTGGVACGTLAGELHGLDSVTFDGSGISVLPHQNGRRPDVHRRNLPACRIVTVHGLRCTDGLQTVVDLAAVADDVRWEQMLESALRKRLTSIAEVEGARPDLGRRRAPGAKRIRRVLAVRPPGAPPTESLLETLMVQLARTVAGLPDPVRQLRVEDAHGDFVARLDLAWPDLGLFLELDGQQHKDQPLYDARRETAVVAATGWLPGRFTWTEVTRLPASTRRRLAALAGQARRRSGRW